MSKKAFLILILITAALFGTAKLQSSKKQTVVGVAEALVSFDLGAVKSLVLSSKDKKLSLKEASPDKWVSESSQGYETQLSKVNALLLKIHELRSNQKITSNPQNYSRLGLGDEEKISLLLQDKDGKTLASLQFGKNLEAAQKNPMMAETGGGRYVKADPGETVYLISQDLALSMEAGEWLNTEFLKIEKKDIAEIQLLKTTPRLSIVNTTVGNTGADQKPAGENADAAKAPVFSLQGLQTGEKAKDWMLDQVLDFFTRTHFTDVLPATDSKMATAPFEPVVEVKTKEGLLYRVFVGTLEKKMYLKLSVEATVPSGQTELPPLLKEKASQLNASHAPWVYNLETWTVATLNKSYKDMIEEAPKPPSEEQKMEMSKPGENTPGSQDQSPEPDQSTPVPSLA